MNIANKPLTILGAGSGPELFPPDCKLNCNVAVISTTPLPIGEPQGFAF